MRSVLLAFVFLNAAGPRACETRATAEVDAPRPMFASAAVNVDAMPPPVFTSAAVDIEAPAPILAADAAANHGGTVVYAGPHPIEVVPQASGQVHAYLPPGVEPPPRSTMRVEVPVKGRAQPRPVEMRWEPAERRYVGVAPSVEIVPGPVDVHYTVGGHPYHGHVATVAVAPVVYVEPGVVVAAPPAVIVTPGIYVDGPRGKWKHGKHGKWKHGKWKHGKGHWKHGKHGKHGGYWGPPGHHPGGPPGHRKHGGGHGHGRH